MALIAAQPVTPVGDAPEFDEAATGDTATVDPRAVLIVRNTNAAARTVTLAAQTTLATGDPYPDKEYTVDATGGEVWIPLLGVYANGDGQAEITYSATEDVTRAVVRL